MAALVGRGEEGKDFRSWKELGFGQEAWARRLRLPGPRWYFHIPAVLKQNSCVREAVHRIQIGVQMVYQYSVWPSELMNE